MSIAINRFLGNSFINLLVVCVIVFACLYYLGQNKLTVGVIPHGDFAADMLVKEKIVDDGYLLTGHYSRFEFNHPGPFFFYVDYLFDISMKPLGRPKSASVFSSILALNGVFIILSVVLGAKLFARRLKLWPMLTAALIIIGYLGHDLHAVWMPHRIVIPYIAFFMTLLLLSRRELAYFPLACLLAAILVHGYLSMVVLALPFVFVFGYAGYKNNPKVLEKREKYYLFAGLLIGVLFASPIFIDLLISESSNIGKVIHQALGNDRSSPKIADILQETSRASFDGFNAVHIIIILMGSYALMSSKAGASLWRSVLITSSTLTLVFVIYHKSVPGPMFNNMVFFTQAIPLALIIICQGALFSDFSDLEPRSIYKRIFVMVLVVMMSIVSIMHLRPANVSQKQHLHIIKLATEIRNLTKQDGYARINYQNHKQWPEIASILFELTQQGYPACSTWQKMAFLYTPGKTCANNESANIKLIPKNNCLNKCSYTAGKYGLITYDRNLEEK